MNTSEIAVLVVAMIAMYIVWAWVTGLRTRKWMLTSCLDEGPDFVLEHWGSRALSSLLFVAGIVIIGVFLDWWALAPKGRLYELFRGSLQNSERVTWPLWVGIGLGGFLAALVGVLGTILKFAKARQIHQRLRFLRLLVPVGVPEGRPQVGRR